MAKFVSPGDIEGKLERKRNRFLSLLRKYPGISRQECAKRMRVSTFNITKLTPELIKQGMVLEDAPAIVASASRGRPSQPLRLVSDYEYFAGIDIEASQWRFVILDFAGNIVHSRIEPFRGCETRGEYIALLEALFKKAISDCGPMWGKVSALGIGAPGFLNSKNGVVERYEILPEFRDIPLLELCRNISGKDACIVNNICNLATNDLWKRPDSDKNIVLYVAVRSGISTALNIRGGVYRGSGGKAGEAGLCVFPGKGILQETAGLSALKKKLPELPEAFWQGDKEVICREFAKDETKQVMCEALELLGAALANIAALLDPDEIVVYSSIFSSENILWKKIRDEFVKTREKQQLPLTFFRRAGNSELNAASGAALYAMEQAYPL